MWMQARLALPKDCFLTPASSTSPAASIAAIHRRIRSNSNGSAASRSGPVVSFAIGGRTVNLIDTPGHPDFIAEVERVLGLLDAAVVVVSAVEGVQAQTRVLVRALRRIGVPFVFFVNKVDRLGARYGEVMEALAAQLAVRPIAMSSVIEAGGKLARVEPLDPGNEPLFSALCEALGENDEALLADYVLDPERLTGERLGCSLADQVARGLVHPVFAGAAMTGAGVPALASAIAAILPEQHPNPGWAGRRQDLQDRARLGRREAVLCVSDGGHGAAAAISRSAEWPGESNRYPALPGRAQSWRREFWRRTDRARQRACRRPDR